MPDSHDAHPLDELQKVIEQLAEMVEIQRRQICALDDLVVSLGFDPLDLLILAAA